MGGSEVIDVADRPRITTEDIGEEALANASVASMLDGKLVQEFRDTFHRIESAMNSIMINREAPIRMSLCALFAGGHVWIEGEPGGGKTRFAKLLATLIGLDFGRIQMTSDKMPSEFAGTHLVRIAENGHAEEDFIPGPLFANLVLIDEGSRTPGKVQGGLLQALEEKQVTVDSKTIDLPNPHMVLMTLNPAESGGAGEIIEALADRFMIGLEFAQAGFQELIDVMNLTTGTKEPELTPIFSNEEGYQRIQEMQKLVRSIQIPNDLLHFAADLCLLLRPSTQDTSIEKNAHQRFERIGILNEAYGISSKIEKGVSPRAANALILMTKANALSDGRATATIDDMIAVAVDVMAHRIKVDPVSMMDGVTPRKIILEAIQILKKYRSEQATQEI
jgi:MoxR-like ATPase